MSDDFIDSSVILYLFDETAPAKRTIARRIIDEALIERSSASAISYQVVQEVLNVIVHKYSPPATADDARVTLESLLMPLCRVMPSQDLYQRALNIQARYHYRFYDSLIVAAALESGCMRLLSEDLQDGQRIEGLTIVNPFQATERNGSRN